MAQVIKCNGEEITITDLLVVCPFSFTAQSRPIVNVQGARAIFRAVTTMIQEDQERPLDTGNLAGASDFVVVDEEAEILKFGNFSLQTAAPAASLDMLQAVWVLRGTQTADVSLEFSPVNVPYDLFNQVFGRNVYWGGEIKAGNDVLLRASLSAPVYDIQGGHVVEYFGLGPAFGHEAGSARLSVFDWVVKQAGVQHPVNGPQPWSSQFGELEVVDLLTKTSPNSHKFFGTDEPGLAQVRNAAATRPGAGQSAPGGAVFVASGGIVNETMWRTLSRFVRSVARESVGAGRDHALLEAYPLTELEQSVGRTAVPEERHVGEFMGSGLVFEGILLWNLQARTGEERVESIHR